MALPRFANRKLDSQFRKLLEERVPMKEALECFALLGAHPEPAHRPDYGRTNGNYRTRHDLPHYHGKRRF